MKSHEFRKSSIKKLLGQASASCFAYIIPVLAQILIQRSLISLDIESLSVYGVVARLETIGVMPVMAISSALTPLVAQNKGAGFFKRCKDAIKKGVIYGSVFSVGYVVFINLFQNFFIDLFSIKGSSQAVFKQMIYLLIPAWLLWALAFVPLGSFYALSCSQWVFKMALLRLAVLFFLLQLFAAAIGPTEIIEILVFSQMIYLMAVVYSLKFLLKRHLTNLSM